MLTLLPIIPTFALMINPIKTQMWMYAVPFVSQNQLITAILRGEAVGLFELAVYVASQLAIAAIILGLAAWRYSSERMALGR
jgi:sodium transport system permease protein